MKGEMPFKMHKTISFSRKKTIKKNHVCLPYLKFSDLLLQTHVFFYLDLCHGLHKALQEVNKFYKKMSSSSYNFTNTLYFIWVFTVCQSMHIGVTKGLINCRPTHGTMRKSHRTFTVTRHL